MFSLCRIFICVIYIEKYIIINVMIARVLLNYMNLHTKLTLIAMNTLYIMRNNEIIYFCDKQYSLWQKLKIQISLLIIISNICCSFNV